MKKKLKSKGFTLIEVLVAMSIISIIVIFFYNALNNTIKMNKKAENDIQMMDIAQSKMENMLSNIRESSDDSEEIEVEINGSIVRLNSLFNNNSIYTTQFEEVYENKVSNYIVDLKIERKLINSGTILSNSYLYNINFSVKEKYKKFSNGQVSMSTSIFSLRK